MISKVLSFPLGLRQDAETLAEVRLCYQMNVMVEEQARPGSYTLDPQVMPAMCVIPDRHSLGSH